MKHEKKKKKKEKNLINRRDLENELIKKLNAKRFLKYI